MPLHEGSFVRPTPPRFVAFSPTRGVFLGILSNHEEVVWSFDKNRTKDELDGVCAPTFTGEADLDAYKKSGLMAEEVSRWPADAELRQVFPPVRTILADVETCANAGLPRWGKTA